MRRICRFAVRDKIGVLKNRALTKGGDVLERRKTEVYSEAVGILLSCRVDVNLGERSGIIIPKKARNGRNTHK